MNVGSVKRMRVVLDLFASTAPFGALGALQQRFLSAASHVNDCAMKRPTRPLHCWPKASPFSCQP